ncbi:protein of unknown function [Aminobacter niigataensis]|nr:protein of unknown function [Aminobacter niigataensis]
MRQRSGAPHHADAVAAAPTERRSKQLRILLCSGGHDRRCGNASQCSGGGFHAGHIAAALTARGAGKPLAAMDWSDWFYVAVAFGTVSAVLWQLGY